MCEIQTDILEKLKCTECKKYLSYPPILLKNDGNSLCGRCSVKDENQFQFIRNKLYETVAEMLKFPCSFNKNGCLDELPSKDMKHHEENCVFRKRNCPLYPKINCRWNSSCTDINEHLESEHKHLTYSNPYCKELHDGVEVFLLTAYELVFVVTLDYKEETKQFTLYVNDLEKNKNTYFKYKCTILTDDIFAAEANMRSSNVNEALCINLEKDYGLTESSKCKFLIEVVRQSCCVCGKALIYPEMQIVEKEYYCEECFCKAINVMAHIETRLENLNISDSPNHRSTQT